MNSSTCCTGFSPFSPAQLAVSANDNKMMLVDGVDTPVSNPLPDTVTILEIGASPPKIVAT